MPRGDPSAHWNISSRKFPLSLAISPGVCYNRPSSTALPRFQIVRRNYAKSVKSNATNQLPRPQGGQLPHHHRRPGPHRGHPHARPGEAGHRGAQPKRRLRSSGTDPHVHQRKLPHLGHPLSPRDRQLRRLPGRGHQGPVLVGGVLPRRRGRIQKQVRDLGRDPLWRKGPDQLDHRRGHAGRPGLCRGPVHRPAHPWPPPPCSTFSPTPPCGCETCWRAW